MRVMNSLLPSCEAPSIGLLFNASLERIRFIDLARPIKNPFSSKLYMFEGVILYLLIFSESYCVQSNQPRLQRKAGDVMRNLYAQYYRNVENNGNCLPSFAYDQSHVNIHL